MRNVSPCAIGRREKFGGFLANVVTSVFVFKELCENDGKELYFILKDLDYKECSNESDALVKISVRQTVFKGT